MSKISSEKIGLMNKNIVRTHGQAEFRGTENTPIAKGINEHQLAEHLERHAQKGDQVGAQSRDLINNHLSQGPWKITAGIHQGGLGGAQGGADPEYHATLSTGHHVRYNDKGIFEITGPGVRESKGRQGPKVPSNSENQIADLMKEHGLTEEEAAKAILQTQGPEGKTLPKAIEHVIGNRKFARK